MKFKRVNIDTGKNSGFILEKKIKEYKEGIDYKVDKTGNSYTILSEGLKSAIWPDDYFWYDDSVVVIDRQGKVESYRMAADNPREPYKIDRNFLKEIMSESDCFDKKEPVIEQQDKQDNKRKEENVVFFLKEDTKEIDKKNNLVPWVVGVSLLFVIPLCFIIKKMLICQRKNKKSCETKQ